MNIFKRKRIAHPQAPGLIQYHAGDTFHPGAMNMVPELMVGNPEYLIKGPGIVVGSMRVTQPQPAFQHLALMVEPPQGTPVGTFAFQGLLSSEPTA